jgi:hypothetical protein
MKTTHIYSYLSIIIFFYPGLISTTNEAAEHRTAHTPTTHSLFPIPTNPPSPPIPNPDSYPFNPNEYGICTFGAAFFVLQIAPTEQ